MRLPDIPSISKIFPKFSLTDLGNSQPASWLSRRASKLARELAAWRLRRDRQRAKGGPNDTGSLGMLAAFILVVMIVWLFAFTVLALSLGVAALVAG